MLFKTPKKLNYRVIQDISKTNTLMKISYCILPFWFSFTFKILFYIISKVSISCEIWLNFSNPNFLDVTKSFVIFYFILRAHTKTKHTRYQHNSEVRKWRGRGLWFSKLEN